MYSHVPVMLQEVLEYLNPKSGQKFVDCTLGGAGYTLALAEKVGSSGKIIGIDLDELAIKNAQEEISLRQFSNIVLVQDNFQNLESVAEENLPGDQFDGIVMDLGLSSAQLADEARGFSFKGEHPLDMAFGPANDLATTDIVNHYPLLELTRIFRDYGEEKQAYRIAKAIVEVRRQKKLVTTADLVAVIEGVIPFRFRSKIHPATRIFQALRMETNQELKVLENVLPAAVKLLKPGGHLVVVSFHSGEDRIVKRFFKAESNLEILTKRPRVPSDTEVAGNARARSAKLRAASKINNF